jgi:predicted small secreted protein
MGYCVEITESTVSFDKEKIGKLMEKVKKDFNDGNIIGSWIDKSDVIYSEDVEDFFYALRLAIFEEDDTYKIDYLSGEKLDECELDLYNSMAEFTNDGYIEYLGEDGEKWRYVFKEGKCEEVYPKLSWD